MPTAKAAAPEATVARRAPPPAATRPSDSLGWPDGPRGTPAAPGSLSYFSRRNLARPGTTVLRARAPRAVKKRKTPGVRIPPPCEPRIGMSLLQGREGDRSLLVTWGRRQGGQGRTLWQRRRFAPNGLQEARNDLTVSMKCYIVYRTAWEPRRKLFIRNLLSPFGRITIRKFGQIKKKKKSERLTL